MPRTRPTPDLQFVLHPETDVDYEHFDGHATVAFDAQAATATRAHAWWLAEAAPLTYWDQAVATARFAAAGLTAEFIEVGETQLYVAHSATAILVVFRGTEADRFGDMFDNAQFALDPWPHGQGLVHHGFQGALERVWTALEAALTALGSSRPVWFGGHSLGAALFNARFGGRSLRYENDTDIVTHIPPPLPRPFRPSYAHVGQLRHIGPDGRITAQPPRLDHFVGDVFGDVGHLQEVVQALRTGVMRRAPAFLLDHMPRGYTVDIWNDLDANGPT